MYEGWLSVQDWIYVSGLDLCMYQGGIYVIGLDLCIMVESMYQG